MLAFAALMLVLVVLAEWGRWRYFETHRLPDGRRINYRKYAILGPSAMLVFWACGASLLNIWLIGILVYGSGPYLELEVRRQLQTARGAKALSIQGPGLAKVFQHWWQSGGVPKDPPDDEVGDG